MIPPRFGDAVFQLRARVDSDVDLEVAKLAYNRSFYHVDKGARSRRRILPIP